MAAGVEVLLLATQAHSAAALLRRRLAPELHRQAVEEVQRQALEHLLLLREPLAHPPEHLTPARCLILQQAAAMMRAQVPERRRVLGLPLVRKQRRALRELVPELVQEPARLGPAQLWAPEQQQQVSAQPWAQTSPQALVQQLAQRLFWEQQPQQLTLQRSQ